MTSRAHTVALLAWPLIAAAVACALAADKAQQPVHAQPLQPAANPHWDPQGCSLCHDAHDREYRPIPTADADALCLKCHDGTRASAEPHAIGRSFESPGVRRPEGWPVVDGRLACLTCHDVLEHCRSDAASPAVDSAFLRGPPQGGRAAFCTKCHESAPAQRPYNPHRVLAASGRIERGACEVCHKGGLPATARAPLTAASDPGPLRQPELVLCTGCHKRHLDYFSPGHIGRVMPAAYTERLISGKCGTDDTGCIPGEAPMPLGEGGRILCSTCHNPHEQGLFAPEDAWGRGGIAVDAEPRRLPFWGLREELCRACHDQ